MAAIRTTCPYCGVGCGVRATVENDGVHLEGDPEHPANRGRLCSKGAALSETLGLDDRLLYPEISGTRVSWPTAIGAVADGFRRVLDAHGADAVAFYVSGQLLTEDYYVANKLMKGFIGGANIDTNSRLCMASAVAGHKRAFGTDSVPGCYDDLELADLIVLVGSNLAWCHPILYQRIAAARKQRPHMRVVVVDPRRTATCETADLHLAITPGSDVALFNGLLDYLRRHDRLDLAFLEQHAEGFAQALSAARTTAPSVPHVARVCGVSEAAIAEFYRLFAGTARTVTAFSQGVNQSASGTDKVNSIINCHLATGRIGQPGMGPFSITGQPNAMGGREVGGLANQLAAHMDFANPVDIERVARFWRSARIARAPGLKAVDMFNAVDDGRIKALWIMATNPAVSLPDTQRVRRALARCDFVVVSDCVRHTDTTRFADVLLPAAAWGEKDGTVTNSERRISRQRAFLKSPGEARADWWIVTQVARAMGFAAAFPYESAGAIFREHARLSGVGNDGRRDFDISALADISEEQYDAFAPLQWPANAAAPTGTARLFADGRFYTPSGKARLIAVTPRPPVNAPSAGYPLALNTGRVRDQWHTMTRTGKSPRLAAHMPEPLVEIHPTDADAHGVRHGELAQLASPWGTAVVRVAVDAGQRPGSIFVPIHWNDQYAAGGCANALVNPETDSISGQPEAKHTPVAIRPYAARWYGFVLVRGRVGTGGFDYWVCATGKDFLRYEIAGTEAPPSWPAWARHVLGADGEWLEFHDGAAGRYRGARVDGGQLMSCVFIAPTPNLPPRTWIGSLFGANALSVADRTNILAGRSPSATGDSGPLVCACFGIGRNTLRAAIRRERLTTVEAVGAVLRAGTNCGSCLPEIKTLLEDQSADRVA